MILYDTRYSKSSFYTRIININNRKQKDVGLTFDRCFNILEKEVSENPKINWFN